MTDTWPKSAVTPKSVTWNPNQIDKKIDGITEQDLLDLLDLQAFYKDFYIPEPLPEKPECQMPECGCPVMSFREHDFMGTIYRHNGTQVKITDRALTQSLLCTEGHPAILEQWLNGEIEGDQARP